MERKVTWETYDAAQLEKLESLNREYRDFLDNGKTERECIDTIVNTIEAEGYQELESLIRDGKKPQKGDKVYSVCMNKSIAMFQIGEKPMAEGMNILGAHIDSPRIDVKQNPLYEEGGFAYLDTHYYGGVKKYQWVALPLALHGVVVKKDGTTIEMNIGENDDDPVFFISDLLVHLAGEQMEKKASKVIEGEALDLIIGSKPIVLTREEKEEDKKEDKDGDASSSGSGSSGSSSSSGTTQTTVRGETASVRVGSDVVKEAVANNSSRIVIKPEISGDVTRTEVAIPAATVGQIKRDTSADLTVSAPAADVTIPHAVLETLSGDVKVVTEQADQAISVTLTAGGRTVESVPGGLTLTIPAENAGPGTVAVLLHEDGTRETLRRSIAADGKVTVPLNGSATVEIVDNSREFADVPSGNWAADAVAFASAHELFSGTSDTTFSPDQVMSRGMLASVLYRLEGSPEQDGAAAFGDVGSDAWYADGVAWATENGIANGYGNGQFGPDDSITREQFVVMLWKYAGSPQAGSQTLGFTDADQVSGYAKEALCWAVECGILSGYDGQLAPGGTATRAQAAQMLKNFLGK